VCYEWHQGKLALQFATISEKKKNVKGSGHVIHRGAKEEIRESPSFIVKECA
jgi:hypothetical protein